MSRRRRQRRLMAWERYEQRVCRLSSSHRVLRGLVRALCARSRIAQPGAQR